MKTTVTLGLLCVALSVSAPADEPPAPVSQPAPAPTPAAAQTLREQLAATLPKYDPPPPVEAKPANAPNPDVLELPKMVVKQKPRPRLTPEVVLTRQAFGDQLAKEKFTQLDRALNSFTLPLFGVGMAERALEEYEREKKAQMASDVNHLAKALETTDPTEAKSLKEAAAKP